MSEGMDSGAGSASVESGAGETPVNETGHSATREQGQTGNNNTKAASKGKAQANKDDDFEEIALGSVKGKVPKSIAKALKEYERGVQGKFQEFAKAKRERDEEEKLWKENPKEVLKRKGIDPDEFAEATLAEKLEMLQMSPEQKRLREHEAKLKEYEKREQEREARESQEREEREYQQHSERFNKEFVDSWADSGLPPDPYFGQLMAAEILKHNKKTGEVLSPKQAASKIKARFQEQTRGIFGNATPEAIIEVLGEGVLKKLREYDLARVSKAPPTVNSGVRPGAPATDTKTKTNKPMNELEWREYINRL